jgi:hypothetical protein
MTNKQTTFLNIVTKTNWSLLSLLGGSIPFDENSWFWFFPIFEKINPVL